MDSGFRLRRPRNDEEGRASVQPPEPSFRTPRKWRSGIHFDLRLARLHISARLL